MTRSTLGLSLGLAFVVVAATLNGCGGGSTGGTAGTSGGTAGTSGGTAGTSGGTAGTSGGTAGTSGGTAGTTGGTAGTTGGTAGTTGGTAGTTGGTAGTTGGTAGTTGTAGRGGTTGTAGRGGAQGDAGSSGTAGRGGTTGTAGRGGTTGTAGRGGTTGTGGVSGGLTLTSTAFTEGMMIPAAQTCTGMSHMSPPLTWTAGPSGTMSYAIALVDMTNGFVHWTIWDIPSTTMSLPGNLPTTRTLATPVMAQQVNRFTGDGYFGPCPSGQTHTYVFEVYALSVATLPGLAASPMPEAVRTAMMANDLASGTLSGMSNASQ